MITKYHASHNKAEAAMRSINAGMDFECPSNWKNYCFSYLPDLIRTGKVKESVLDSAVIRVLRNKFILGLFEKPYIKNVSDTEKQEMQKSYRLLALKAAKQGMILLRNENKTLPFNENKIRKLAVIGPNADEVHYGNYSNDISPGISILEGMKSFGKGKFEVFFSEGFKIYENDNSIPKSEKTALAEDRRIADAVKLAKSC
jgi:beta-glucosidase